MQEIITQCFLALNNPKKYNTTLYKNITSKNTPRFKEKIKLTASKKLKSIQTITSKLLEHNK